MIPFPTAEQEARPNTECVEYFSFPFDCLDLHTCWQKATKSTKSLKCHDAYVKGKRLENITWRRYFQNRWELPQIHPSELNWKKDLDHCSFFGNFHGNKSEPSQYEFTLSRVSSCNLNRVSMDSNETLHDDVPRPKSVLKKKLNLGDFVTVDTKPLRKIFSDSSILLEERKSPLDLPRIQNLFAEISLSSPTSPTDILKEYFNDVFGSRRSSTTKQLRFSDTHLEQTSNYSRQSFVSSDDEEDGVLDIDTDIKECSSPGELDMAVQPDKNDLSYALAAIAEARALAEKDQFIPNTVPKTKIAKQSKYLELMDKDSLVTVVLDHQFEEEDEAWEKSFDSVFKKRRRRHNFDDDEYGMMNFISDTIINTVSIGTSFFGVIQNVGLMW